jgi:hypothetical protein
VIGVGVAVLLGDLRVVDAVTPDGVHDGRVQAESIGAELDALPRRHPIAQVGEERVAVLHRALTDEPRRDELRVGVDRNPRPHVTKTG